MMAQLENEPLMGGNVKTKKKDKSENWQGGNPLPGDGPVSEIPTPVSEPVKAAPSPERPSEAKSATPRRLSSPDIQAMAKIDRILSSQGMEQAVAMLEYLTCAWKIRQLAAAKPKQSLCREQPAPGYGHNDDNLGSYRDGR